MVRSKENLDKYMANYTNFNDWLIRRRYKLLKDYLKGSSCLELGPAHGEGTGYLLEHFKKVVAVDGSKKALAELKTRFPTDNLEPVHSFFEKLDLKQKFDTLVLAHILEHVDEPQVVLKEAKRFCKPDGVMIIDVPNGMSLHRQIGVELGLLKQPTDLNEADRSIGHKRVYIPETFRKEIDQAGLEIIKFGGMFVKILSNAQTERTFDDKQLEALFKTGERYPEIAAEIYVIAKPK